MNDKRIHLHESSLSSVGRWSSSPPQDDDDDEMREGLREEKKLFGVKDFWMNELEKWKRKWEQKKYA